MFTEAILAQGIVTFVHFFSSATGIYLVSYGRLPIKLTINLSMILHMKNCTANSITDFVVQAASIVAVGSQGFLSKLIWSFVVVFACISSFCLVFSSPPPVVMQEEINCCVRCKKKAEINFRVRCKVKLVIYMVICQKLYNSPSSLQ
jgi:hypothetical protein